MIRLTLILPLLTLLTACATLGLSSGGSGNFILNKRVAEAYGNPEYALQRGRAPLVMRSGRSVDNCVAYLEAGGFDQVAADVNSRITPSQYLICDTLAALKDARPLADGDYRPDGYGEALVNRLDLRSFRSSLSENAQPGHATVAAIKGLDTDITDHAVTVDARDWLMKLETVAVGHVNGNEQPDWLVWLLDESNSGMYRSHQLLMIPDVTAEGPLHAEKYRL